MKLFTMLALELGAKCNRSCVFCPNHENERPDEYMDPALLQKIIEELADLRYSGRITPYIYNEPLLHPSIYMLSEWINREVPRACLMISTNGDKLRGPEDIAALYDAGYRQVLVNIYSAADGGADPTKVQRGIRIAEERAKVVEGWFAQVGADMERSVYDYAPRNARRGKVERKFGISPDTKKLARFELQNRSGNIAWFKKGPDDPLEQSCVRPFRFLNINWKGKALVCCNDFHGETPVGDANHDSLVEIWNGDLLNLYRLYLVNRNRDLPLCRNCDYGGGSYKHLVQRGSLGPEVLEEKLLAMGGDKALYTLQAMDDLE